MPIKQHVVALPPMPTHEVTIPDECPECGASFHAPWNLAEMAYTQTSQPMHIKPGEDIDWELREECGESQIIVGFYCLRCNAAVAGDPYGEGEVGGEDLCEHGAKAGECRSLGCNFLKGGVRHDQG